MLLEFPARPSRAQDDACKSIIMVQTVAGLLFSKEQDWGEALKACHGARSLEQHAVCVQAYLGMDRPDKALEQVKKMEEADEDATLTQVGAEEEGTTVQAGFVRRHIM